ncbi:RCC1 domain-containing protein [Candidatus Izemoplasma sp. B36]|uniref:RCC1 domain-containing protein n=1 Tax=Candidatus Izemoplasma sp. B36 TaxID=3242468 RepID=UPI003558673E
MFKKILFIGISFLIIFLSSCDLSSNTTDITTTMSPTTTIFDTTLQSTEAATTTIQETTEMTEPTTLIPTTKQSTDVETTILTTIPTTTVPFTTTNQQYNISYYTIGVTTLGEVPLDEDEIIIDLEMNRNSAGAITSKGRLFVWGENSSGQLGDGTNHYIISPLDITSAYQLAEGEKIISFAVGSQATAAVTSFGRLFTCGYNGNAQLGDKNVSQRFTPGEVTGITLDQGDQIIKVSLGEYHGAILTQIGRVFTWGYNTYGCVGIGEEALIKVEDIVEITDAFSLTGSDKIVQVDLRKYNSAAISEEGRVFVWGYNMHYELGDNTTNTSYSPKEITSFFDFIDLEIITQISVGGYHSSAVTSTGRLFTWGYNAYGQLGDLSTENGETPNDVTANFVLSQEEKITNTSSSAYHSVAITSLGRVFTFGRNNNGQLGIDTMDYDPHATPIDISDRFSMVGIDLIEKSKLGIDTTMLISLTGRIYGFGLNNAGQIGNHSITSSYVPVEITVFDKTEILYETYDVGASITFYSPIHNYCTFYGWYLDETLINEAIFTTMPSYSFNVYGMWVKD